jgi:hypothetical protein
MRDVFDLEPTTRVPRESSYVLSYPHILAYFQSREAFDEGDFVRGAHMVYMVYGWMPTALDLYPQPPELDLKTGARLLTLAKRCGDLADADLQDLARLVNNSLVGASKLLHFAAPERFAIWDSKIYAFVFEEKPYNYRVNRSEPYRQYLATLVEICARPAFPAFRASVNAKLGYDVSSLRAIELVMFLNAQSIEG